MRGQVAQRVEGVAGDVPGRIGDLDKIASPVDLARFTAAWTVLPAKPWRWPGPGQTLWTQDGLLAWTMVNDRPGTPVTEASTYSIFVGARSNPDLIHVDDAGIAWDTDTRDEL